MYKNKEELLIEYIKKGNTNDAAKLLLTYPNINVNYADNDGWTGLIYASKRGKTECVKLLLKHPNINVNHADKIQGATALHFAALYIEKNHHKKVVINLLLKHPNINPLQQDIYGTCYFDDIIAIPFRLVPEI